MELPDIEVVSAKVHEAWIATKRAQGITRHLDRNRCTKDAAALCGTEQ